MKLYILLLCLLVPALLFAQTPEKTWQTNGSGTISSLFKTGDSLFCFGSASRLEDNVGNLVSLNPLTLQRVEPNPSVTYGEIKKMISDGNNGYYILGYYFNRFNQNLNGMLHVDSLGRPIADLTINTNAGINDFYKDGNVLYLAGAFSTINGVNRRYVAAYDLNTNSVTPFNPSPDAACTEIKVAGTTAFIRGSFTAVGNFFTSGIAMANKISGVPLAIELGIASVAGNLSMYPYGNSMYFAGRMYSFQGSNAYKIVRVNGFTGLRDSWTPIESRINNNLNNYYVIFNITFTPGCLYICNNTNNSISNKTYKVDSTSGNTLASVEDDGCLAYGLQVIGNKLYTYNYARSPKLLVASYSLSNLRRDTTLPDCELNVNATKMYYLNNKLIFTGTNIAINSRNIPNFFALKETNNQPIANLPVITSNSGSGYYTAINLKFAGSRMYLYGLFNSLNSITRTGYGCYDFLSNTITLENLGSSGYVADLLIGLNNNYVAGSFTNAGRIATNGLVSVNRTNADATALRFQVPRTIGETIKIKKYNDKIVAVQTGYNGSVDRTNANIYDAITGALLPNSIPIQDNGYSSDLIETIGNKLFYKLRRFDFVDEIGVYDLDRNVILPIKATTNGIVRKISGAGNFLVIDGSFTQVNGEARANGLAFLDPKTMNLLDFNPPNTSDVKLLLLEPTKAYIFSYFRTQDGLSAQGIQKYPLCYTNPPSITASGITTFCQGNSVTLTAPAGNRYLWSNGATTRAITVSTSGNYSVKFITDSCNSSLSIPIKVNIITQVKDSVYRRICQGQQVNFYGTIITSSGRYTYIRPSGNGCDTLKIIKIDYLPVNSVSVSRTICAGNQFLFNSRLLTVTGNYTATFRNRSGCDSIVNLNLIVQGVQTGTINRTICSNAVYNFNNRILFRPGTYIDSLRSRAGCDSVAILNLIVVPVTSSLVTANICRNESYNFNGRILSTAGTYEDYLINRSGCDSVIRLELRTVPESRTFQSINICSGSTFRFGTANLFTSGIYIDTLRNRFSCDSIATIQLRVNPRYDTVVNRTICRGSIFPFGARLLDVTGSYRDTLRTLSNCDSIVNLNLTVQDPYSITVSRRICSNKFYRFNGNNLTQSGVYNARLNSRVGCDSNVTLLLTVINTTSSAINTSICRGSTYRFNGRNFSLAGTYYDTLRNTDGCDSLVTLNLVVRNPSFTSLQASICAGNTYNFRGRNLQIAGLYADTATNSSGCDSVITLQLAVRDNPFTNINRVICSGSSYVFNGVPLSTAGDYRQTLRSAAGCDSLVQLSLAVSSVSNTNIAAQICVGGSYFFRGRTIKTIGIYRDTLKSANGCDSIISLTLSNLPENRVVFNASFCKGTAYAFRGKLLYDAGTYVDTLVDPNGCYAFNVLNLRESTPLPKPITSSIGDSIFCTSSARGYLWYRNNILLGNERQPYLKGDSVSEYKLIVLNVEGCPSDTSASVRLKGLPKYPNYVTVYPNPFKEDFTISLSGFNVPNVNILISDAMGKVIWEQNVAIPKGNKQFTVTGLQLASGLYTLQIRSVEANKLLRIVKN